MWCWKGHPTKFPLVGLEELNGSCCISSLLWMDEKVSSVLHTTDKEIECLQPLFSILSLNNPSILLGYAWARIMGILFDCVRFKHTNGSYTVLASDNWLPVPV